MKSKNLPNETLCFGRDSVFQLCVVHQCYPGHDYSMDDIDNEQDTLSLPKHNVSFGRFLDFISQDFDLTYLYISTVSNKGPNPHHRNLVLVLNYIHLCLLARSR
jgi:hypothetical protein